MDKAKFEIGQTVVFERGLGDGHVPAGEFTILRAMPVEEGQRSYRVRGKQDGHQRVLPETQMRIADGRLKDSEGEMRVLPLHKGLLGMI